MKGSDFWIDAEIKHFNPTAMFRPVDHSDAMSKGDYPGSPDVVESYCPYPVPSYYQLFYTVHQVRRTIFVLIKQRIMHLTFQNKVKGTKNLLNQNTLRTKKKTHK